MEGSWTISNFYIGSRVVQTRGYTEKKKRQIKRQILCWCEKQKECDGEEFDFEKSKWVWSEFGRGGSFSGNDGCVC